MGTGPLYMVVLRSESQRSLPNYSYDYICSMSCLDTAHFIPPEPQDLVKQLPKARECNQCVPNTLGGLGFRILGLGFRI